MKFHASALAVVTLIVATGAVAQPNGGSVVDLYDAAISSIKSYDVFLTVTETRCAKFEAIGNVKSVAGELIPTYNITPIPNEQRRPSKPKTYRQVRQRGLARIESFNSETKQSNGVRVANAEAEKVIGQLSASIGPPSLEFASDGADYEQLFRSDFGRCDLLTLIRSRHGLRHYSISENGTEMPALDVAPEPLTDFSRFGVRVVLDPSNSLMPHIIERYCLFDGKPWTVKRTVIQSFHRVRGFVVPTAARTTLYISEPGPTQGLVNLEREVTVDLDRSSWNTEVPASAFQLTFPPGMQVLDRWRNVALPAGSPDAQRHLETLATDAARIVPVDSHPIDSGGKLWKIAKMALYVIACLALFASSALLLRSRFRRSR